MIFSQRFRVVWIDAMVARGFGINRADVTATFGVSKPQASTDLREHQRRFPGAMIYDTSLKRYTAGSSRSGIDPAVQAAVLKAATAMSTCRDLFP